MAQHELARLRNILAPCGRHRLEMADSENDGTADYVDLALEPLEYECVAAWFNSECQDAGTSDGRYTWKTRRIVHS